jgi:hypothetical protein
MCVVIEVSFVGGDSGAKAGKQFTEPHSNHPTSHALCIESRDKKALFRTKITWMAAE